MMNNKKSTYNLNGKNYSHHELLNISEDIVGNISTPGWEKEIFQFISEWLNYDDIIEVKTSGSTGTPKIIRFKKWQLIESARRTGQFFNLKRFDKILLCLPASSIAGKLMIVRSLILGLELHYIKPQGNPLRNISTEFEFSAFTPHQVWRCIEEGSNFNLIKTLIIGGGKASSELIDELQNISTECYATYGMTETLTHIALQKLNGHNKQDSFKVFPDIRIRTDKRNCICIRAPYLEDEVITNDIVTLTNKDQFRFIGRYDNVINSGGVKIYPEEIEDKIYDLIQHPFFISSASDEIFDKKVILIIESPEYEQNKKDKLIKELKLRLDSKMVPKEIKFIKEISRTESGKILRANN